MVCVGRREEGGRVARQLGAFCWPAVVVGRGGEGEEEEGVEELLRREAIPSKFERGREHCVHVSFRLQSCGKEMNLRALFSIFIEKRLLRWDSNPRPPAFKAVALPTEPPRQPGWLGSNHASYTRQRV